jgi:hypothetical protein
MKKGERHTEESKKKISNALKGSNNPFYGRSHTEESKKKMRSFAKGRIGYFRGKNFLMNIEKTFLKLE